MSYRDRAQKWAGVLLVMLAVNAVFDLGLMAASYSQIDLLERLGVETVTDQEVTNNDARFAFLAYGGVVVFVLTAVVWLIWLYRAYRALTETGSQATDRSPGWAVGCWFLPLLNLLHPYRITRELWQRSESQNADSTVAPREAPLVALWWLLYLANGLVSRIASRQGGESLEALISATRFTLFASLLGVVSAAVAFAMVRSLKSMQARWSDRQELVETF